MNFIKELEALIEFFEENGSNYTHVKKAIKKIKALDYNKQLKRERQIARSFFESIKSHLSQYFNGDDKLSFLADYDISFAERDVGIRMSTEYAKLSEEKKESFDELLYSAIYSSVVHALNKETDEKIVKLREALLAADPEKKSNFQLGEALKFFKTAADKYKNKIDKKKGVRDNMKTILSEAAEDDELLDLIDDYATRAGEMSSTMDIQELIGSMGIDANDISSLNDLKKKVSPNVFSKIREYAPDIDLEAELSK